MHDVARENHIKTTSLNEIKKQVNWFCAFAVKTSFTILRHSRQRGSVGWSVKRQCTALCLIALLVADMHCTCSTGNCEAGLNTALSHKNCKRFSCDRKIKVNDITHPGISPGGTKLALYVVVKVPALLDAMLIKN